MSRHPSRCENRYYEHDGHLHQFGLPRTDSRNDLKCSDSTKHEAKPENKSEIKHTRFQNQRDSFQ